MVNKLWTKLCKLKIMIYEDFSLAAQRIKHLPAMQETWIWSLGREDPLEKEMATHSSILAWRIPWTEEPGRLQSMGSQRVRYNWATSLSFFFFLSFFLWLSSGQESDLPLHGAGVWSLVRKLRSYILFSKVKKKLWFIRHFQLHGTMFVLKYS